MNNRIRQLRKTKGLSQLQLAQTMGISGSAIGMYEQGRREPDTDTLLNLAKIFNVTVDYLIGASDVTGTFDVDAMAKDIAKNLIDNPALMFSGDCYTQQELDDLCDVIEGSVKTAMIKKLKQS